MKRRITHLIGYILTTSQQAVRMSEPRKELGILKTHFCRSQGGTWEIQALTSIMLRPRVGNDDSGFFEIRDDIVVRQPNLVGTTTSVLGQSIVPVVAQVSDEHLLRCLGTGFFISCSGLLITAAHVITDPITRQYGGVRELDDQTWHFGDLKIGVMRHGYWKESCCDRIWRNEGRSAKGGVRSHCFRRFLLSITRLERPHSRT